MLTQPILAHAAACWPQESCGLVIKHGAEYDYLPCQNIAPQPELNFEIAAEQWLQAEAKGKLVALVHSHPDGKPYLSAGDRLFQQRTALPWWLVCQNQLYKFHPVPLLLGRQFKHGSMDCYSLFRDAYHLAGHDFPDFSRQDEWWHTGQDLYLDNLSHHGFYQVDSAEEGDIILICLGSTKASHAAIYLGGQQLLHHCPNRLSKRDNYDGFWLNYTHSIWRYQQWSKLDFTAICNDLAASSNSM